MCRKQGDVTFQIDFGVCLQGQQPKALNAPYTVTLEDNLGNEIPLYSPVAT